MHEWRQEVEQREPQCFPVLMPIMHGEDSLSIQVITAIPFGTSLSVSKTVLFVRSDNFAAPASRAFTAAPPIQIVALHSRVLSQIETRLRDTRRSASTAWWRREASRLRA